MANDWIDIETDRKKRASGLLSESNKWSKCIFRERKTYAERKKGDKDIITITKGKFK